MPSFSDSIFLFVLALLLFGPKKLPVLARELGKWIGEFRRASNEFKMQMEEELRASEQAERQKQIAAMEAAAPVAPSLESEPEHPHLPSAPNSDGAALEAAGPASAEPGTFGASPDGSASLPDGRPDRYADAQPARLSEAAPEASPEPLPIASSGSIHLMQPSTGLPTPRVREEKASDPLGGLIESIPTAPERPVRHREPQGHSREPQGHSREPQEHSREPQEHSREPQGTAANA